VKVIIKMDRHNSKTLHHSPEKMFSSLTPL